MSRTRSRPLLPFELREQLAANSQRGMEAAATDGGEGPLARHLRQSIEEHRDEVVATLSKALELGEADPVLRPHLLLDELDVLAKRNGKPELQTSAFYRMLQHTKEVVVWGGCAALAVRPGVGEALHVLICISSLAPEAMSVSHFLEFKERIVLGVDKDPRQQRRRTLATLEVDVEPFLHSSPRVSRPSSIGDGVRFLNRSLSSKMFADKAFHPIYDFLTTLRHQGCPLMLNRRVRSGQQLEAALALAERYLEGEPDKRPAAELLPKLAELGLERGWGRDAARMRDTIRLLLDILEAPDSQTLERFLGRLPVNNNVAILSPHGFFGQKDVLGKPDTGGQVVYILDQVKALEKELAKRAEEQGLDIHPQIVIVTRLIPEAQGTLCGQRLERVEGTRWARILRVPFRRPDGTVLENWISRFQVWPYLEQFAVDLSQELLKEMGGRPDFLIGNYSDGNLVASLLSHTLNIPQANIAHALEKSKYTGADVNWKQFKGYNFEVQFTADLIAMNTADFIITSTYQEIAGTHDSVGQYEAHTSFTLPSLYRVVSGIDIRDSKFNVVSPGADPATYFAFNARDAPRLTEYHAQLHELLYGPESATAVGQLQDPGKPVAFSMARLDQVKNITGLVSWFAGCPRLQRLVNLVVVAGVVDVSQTDDREEREQCEKMHAIIREHKLQGCLRWVVAQKDPRRNGELYRMVADSRGAFVQPALYEAFGLTVVEAMTCGLPTFATLAGGPAEIIQHGRSGFHIDPYHGEQAAELMADFFEGTREEPARWDRLSEGALERVRTRYTWGIYAERLVTLARIYSFWKQTSRLQREESRRYLEMLYILMLRPLIAQLDKPAAATADPA